MNAPLMLHTPKSERGRFWPFGRRAHAAKAPAHGDRPGYSLLGALSIGTGLVMIALIVALIVAVFSSVFRVQDATNWARRSQALGRDLHELLVLVTTAESSQRGFILTNETAYLEPYAQAQREMEINLSRLHSLAADNYVLQRQLKQAEGLIRAKFTEMQGEIDQAQNGHRDDALSLLRSGRGRELSRQLEQLDRTTYAAEAHESDTWQAEQQSWERKVLRMVAAVAVLGMLLVVTAVCVVMLYLSQRARAEWELLSARDQAVDANRAKSRFLAAASHDLRQPLHALNLLLRTLERRIGDGRDSDLVRSARAASMSMARMFDGLLDISRLDAGVIEPRTETFSLGEIMDDLRAEYAAMARDKGLAFEIDASPAKLTTDKALLESILSNLITNAINFTTEGSVTILARDLDGFVSIDVCDTGRGIPEAELERVFEEFHRIDHVQSGQGLGLGLSIVRRLARLLRVELELRSQHGQGSVFSLKVPHALSDLMVPKAPQFRTESQLDLRGKTVLLVDDEPLGREAMRCELGDWGMNVVLAADAEEALAFLSARQITLDVAIVDRDLGSHISGPDLLDRLATDLGIAVPAIVITGATDTDTLHELEETGYTYLIKPVDEVTLRRALNDVMAESAIPLDADPA